MATGDRKDPYRGFNFRVEVDNITVGTFRDASGLPSDGDIVEYREGTDGQLHVRKLVGLRKFSSITVKRGYTDNRELWNWYREIVEGFSRRRDGVIILMTEEGNDVRRWEFKGGLILKIDGPAFNAKGSDVAIESLEIARNAVSFSSARTTRRLPSACCCTNKPRMQSAKIVRHDYASQCHQSR